MHVVKPVVVRTSLADTNLVTAARSSIPTSHREESGGNPILVTDGEGYAPSIFFMCRARCLTRGREVVYAKR